MVLATLSLAVGVFVPVTQHQQGSHPWSWRHLLPHGYAMPCPSSVVACGGGSGQETAARVVPGGTNGTDTGSHWVLLKMVTQGLWECLIGKEPLGAFGKTNVALNTNSGRLGLSVFESQQVYWLTDNGEVIESFFVILVVFLCAFTGHHQTPGRGSSYTPVTLLWYLCVWAVVRLTSLCPILRSLCSTSLEDDTGLT